MLAFAKRCGALRRFHYVSTRFVSGRSPGEFREDMLEEAQSFNNYYEQTKYLAEVEVQRAMHAGVVDDDLPSRGGGRRHDDGCDSEVRRTVLRDAVAAAPADGRGDAGRRPPFREYASRLVAFMRAHPDLNAAAMS